MTRKINTAVEKNRAETHARKVIADEASMLTRCRSLTVGSCGGGQIELIMRSNEEYWTWHIMQPVEAIELIHQLAGQVGCHIAVQPRKDFASWRKWNITEEEKQHFGPWSPQPDMQGLMDETAMELPPTQEQPGLSSKTMALGEKNAVATKKTVKRKAAKRTRKAS